MDKQREILEALGWREAGTPLSRIWHSPKCTSKVNEYGYRIDGSCSPDCCLGVPNLSDPGVFWPLLDAWCKSNAHSYMHRWQWSYKYVLSISIGDANKVVRGSYGEGESGTEAGINAWHAALVAMGKIPTNNLEER